MARLLIFNVLVEGGPLVVFVDGLAGVGKSQTRTRRSPSRHAIGGATVLPVRLPGDRTHGAWSPRPRWPTRPADRPVARRTRLLASGGTLAIRLLLVLDTYEAMRLFDSWLLRRFVPLSSNVRVVLSGRKPPMSGWESAFGDLFRDLPLVRLRTTRPRCSGRRASRERRSSASTASRAATRCR